MIVSTYHNLTNERSNESLYGVENITIFTQFIELRSKALSVAIARRHGNNRLPCTDATAACVCRVANPTETAL
jgi:hypothetical protein